MAPVGAVLDFWVNWSCSEETCEEDVSRSWWEEEEDEDDDADGEDDDEEDDDVDGINGMPKRLRSSLNSPGAAAVAASTVSPNRSSREMSPTEYATWPWGKREVVG